VVQYVRRDQFLEEAGFLNRRASNSVFQTLSN